MCAPALLAAQMSVYDCMHRPPVCLGPLFGRTLVMALSSALGMAPSLMLERACRPSGATVSPCACTTSYSVASHSRRHGPHKPLHSVRVYAAASHRQHHSRAGSSMQHAPRATLSGTDTAVDQAPALEQSAGEAEVLSSYVDWRFGTRIKYLHAGTSGPAILLVHGFGVGCYHWERNIGPLAKQHQVWAVDLMGQGSSFPERDPDPEEGPLRYSIDTWTEQLLHFIQEVIKQPCYVAGNSLGGLLAITLAARHPAAVKGLVLLNATPFWSMRPHADKAGGIWKLVKADGAVPVPQSIKHWIKSFWWDSLRSPTTIRSMLQMVYQNHKALDAGSGDLIARIVEATEHPRALDAFASIVMSPGTRETFDELVAAVEAPILMAYGRDDPWVVPLWGQRLQRSRPDAAYYELTPVGHCPQHEAPQAVNWIVEAWVAGVEAGQGTAGPLQVGSSFSISEGDHLVEVTHVAGAPRNVFEHTDFAVWRLQRAWQGAVESLRRRAGADQMSSGG